MLASTALRGVTARAACASHRFTAPSLLRASSASSVRAMSELPYHIVVGMPALSPTMESGTLAEWNVKEGDFFQAGDSVAKIDTDKASIDFEAQDDGYVAKLLIPGNTEDVGVGVPIMVTVEEEDDVAAFADFVAPEAAAAPEAPGPTSKEEAPVAAASAPPPPPPPATEPAAPPPPPVVEEPVVAAAAPAEPPVAAPSSAPTMGPAWGTMAKVASPLAKTLAAQQQAYVDSYGTTGQVPL